MQRPDYRKFTMDMTTAPNTSEEATEEFVRNVVLVIEASTETTAARQTVIATEGVCGHRAYVDEAYCGENPYDGKGAF